MNNKSLNFNDILNGMDSKKKLKD